MPSEPEESLTQQVSKIRDDLRIYEALSRAMSDPRAVLETILGSEDVVAAQAALRDQFGFDEVQALAVLDVQFRQATLQDRRKMGERHEEMQALLATLTEGGD